MRSRPIALLAALAAVAATTLAAAPAQAAPAKAGSDLAAAVTLPASDPFYRYANSADGKAKIPLATVPAGTVLATRSVDLAVTSVPLPAGFPATAEQLLYRTADELGKPTVTVTTVLVPGTSALTSAVGGTNVVAYLSFYDALSGQCDPSYTLQGGSPGPSSNDELTDLEQGLVEAYQTGGVVTVPDFEGENLDWTAGHEAGYGTLDAVRATESYLKLPATTKVGLTGYSGGSIAADWASELQPAYAPKVDLVGVAEGGVPVDFAHNLSYIDGSDQWSGIIPAVLDALSRSYGVDLDTYLSPLGKQLTATDRDECIGQFIGSHPGLTVAQLLKPQYRNFLQVPAFVTIINKLIMGTAPGHPLEPLYLAVGNDPSNGTGQYAGKGDDIMVTADVEALAHEYCSQGVSVVFTEFPGLPHEEAAVPFEAGALAFLTARFNGVQVPSTCATVPAGNSLAPIAITRKTTTTATPTPTFSTAVKGLTVTRTAATPTAATGTLAFTGSTAAPAIAALVLLGAGGVTAAIRRRR